MNLIISHLTKKYNNNKIAINDVSITVTAGILGLLGPNGAGKSTLMKIIATIAKPTTGSVTLNDKNVLEYPDEMRKLLGYLPQDFGVYENLNAFEFLGYMGALKGLGGVNLKKRIELLLDAVNLTGNARYPIKTYSGGMKQRIGIVQALLNNPKVLILDEPTVGLDPEERIRFRELLTSIAQDCIVILSSHIVSDIESVADQIAIMQGGNLIINCPQAELLDLVKDKVFEQLVDESEISSMSSANLIISRKRIKDKTVIRFVNNASHPNDGSKQSPATLEDAYFYLTQ